MPTWPTSPSCPGRWCSIVGSEGAGLSRLVREACDSLAAIPISATIESLNAGVAAGIALYEISRRREMRISTHAPEQEVG